MRTLLIPLLLAATVCAEDNAADLFYKAFWEEQAGGKTADARGLYMRVLKQHAKSPEAPRALLGIIRIDARRGKDVTKLIEQLAKQYPEAEADLRQARRIAAAYSKQFNAVIKHDDPPALKKIKLLYGAYSSGIVNVHKEDENFLIDAGALAHPMLRELLRETSPQSVRIAANLLLEQRTPATTEIVADALDDDLVPLRGVIVDSVRRTPEGSEQLAEALIRLCGSSGARLRRDVIKCLRAVGYFAQAAEYERICDVFTHALDDPDQRVRYEAASPPVRLGSYDYVPDKFVGALVKRLESGDTALGGAAYSKLPHYAHRKGMSKRIEAVLLKWHPLQPHNIGKPKHEEGAYLLARVALQQWNASEPQQLVGTAASWSPRGATEMVLFAIKKNDQLLARTVLQWVKKMDVGAENADRLRAAALATPGPASDQVLNVVGLGAKDFPVVLRTLEAHAEGGVPKPVRDRKFIRAIGPENAAKLVPFAKDQKELEYLLVGGVYYLKRGGEHATRSVVFFEAILPRVGPWGAHALREAADLSPAVAALLATRLLGERGEEWMWHDVRRTARGVPRGGHSGWAPHVWASKNVADACFKQRDRMLRYVLDDRVIVAARAVHAARTLKNDAGTKALVSALDSKDKSIRTQALDELAKREMPGIEALGKFLAREGLESTDRYYALKAFQAAGDKRAAPVVVKQLARRTDDVAKGWETYSDLAPQRAINLALAEALNPEASKGFRSAAVRVLTRTDDWRRIEVFRRILKNEKNTDLLSLVLGAVSSQYLVELGPEILPMLRNPDKRVREAATQGITRLKFYAEAQKTFRDAKK